MSIVATISHLNHPLWLGWRFNCLKFHPVFWGENPWLNHPWFSSIKKERFRCLRPGLTTVWIYKHPVNNGINYQPQLVQDFCINSSFSRLLNQILEKNLPEPWVLLRLTSTNDSSKHFGHMVDAWNVPKRRKKHVLKLKYQYTTKCTLKCNMLFNPLFSGRFHHFKFNKKYNIFSNLSPQKLH